jgi:hypothetical protein
MSKFAGDHYHNSDKSKAILQNCVIRTEQYLMAMRDEVSIGRSIYRRNKFDLRC